MKTRKGEEIRKCYQYRRLVLSGKADLPHPGAVRLIGPDCAYHLYARHSGSCNKPKGEGI